VTTALSTRVSASHQVGTGSGQRPDWRKTSGSFKESDRRYHLDERKIRTFVVPKPPFDHSVRSFTHQHHSELTRAQLRPYVAKTTQMTDDVKRQWPSRWKRTVTDPVTKRDTIEDVPFDSRVDGHYLLALGRHFAQLSASRSPEELAYYHEARDRDITAAALEPRTEVDGTGRTELEIAKLDPHIETPFEVMAGERRPRRERAKVAIDREIEAMRVADGLSADRDADVDFDAARRARWADEAVMPVRSDVTRAAWDPRARKARRKGPPAPPRLKRPTMGAALPTVLHVTRVRETESS
jgi:hypothetical protein